MFGFEYLVMIFRFLVIGYWVVVGGLGGWWLLVVGWWLWIVGCL